MIEVMLITALFFLEQCCFFHHAVVNGKHICNYSLENCFQIFFFTAFNRKMNFCSKIRTKHNKCYKFIFLFPYTIYGISFLFFLLYRSVC